jgi:hypothetical protein
MKHRAIFLGHLALLIALLTVLVTAVPASADPVGEIQCQLINGTEDGNTELGNYTLTLVTYNGTALESMNSTVTEADGTFLFTELETAPGFSYGVMVDYQEVTYYSSLINFGGNSTQEPANITVFDSTDSDEMIEVTISHTLVELSGDSLEMREMYNFTNTANTTYIGSEEVGDGRMKTLSFSLPEGATVVQYSREYATINDIVATDEGFADTTPVAPGPTTATVTYTVPYSSDTYAFSKTMYYHTERYDLLVDLGVEASCDQLDEQPETFDSGSGQYAQFTGEHLDAGDSIAADLTSTGDGGSDFPVLWIVVGVLGAALLGLLAYVMLRGRDESPAPVAVRYESDVDVARERLLREIADLDDDYEEGNISEAEYQTLRATKKEELLRIISERND